MNRLLPGTKDGGQALVELALAISVLLFLLLGIMEFARIGHAYLVVLHASREGARLAALGWDDNAILTRVKEAAASLPPEELSIQISPARGERFPGGRVEVAVSHDVDIIAPLFSEILPDPFTVVGRTIMRVE